MDDTILSTKLKPKRYQDQDIGRLLYDKNHGDGVCLNWIDKIGIRAVTNHYWYRCIFAKQTQLTCSGQTGVTTCPLCRALTNDKCSLILR